jgi:hypothetical protein
MDIVLQYILQLIYKPVLMTVFLRAYTEIVMYRNTYISCHFPASYRHPNTEYPEISLDLYYTLRSPIYTVESMYYYSVDAQVFRLIFLGVIRILIPKFLLPDYTSILISNWGFLFFVQNFSHLYW